MSKFIIHCTTYWVSVHEDYAAIADSELELEEIADQLSSDLFNMYDCWEQLAEAEGFEVEAMTEEDWDDLYENIDEYLYRGFSIEEVAEDDLDTLEYWKELELVYTNETTQDK